MTDAEDPLDGIEPPPLIDQIAPYRKYGDTELAVSLLAFGKREGAGVPMLRDSGESIGTFQVNSQPAAAGADYFCENCEENVRGVSRSASTILTCPLCGEQPGMLTLGRGPKDTGADSSSDTAADTE